MKSYLFFPLVTTLQFSIGLSAQVSFTKINDPNNSLTTVLSGQVFRGCSWVDVNQDGWLDFYDNTFNLHYNNGDGTFTASENLFAPSPAIGLGNTWGDVDNDGDLDLFIASSPSKFYRNNNGNFSEEELTDTPIETFFGWSPSWADFDNDGWLDLFVTHPAEFLPGTPNTPIVSHENFWFRNKGDGTFTQIFSGDPVMGLAAHTGGNWSDFDLDGDVDLFVGSGEVSFLSKDHIYVNQLIETGEATLKRLSGIPLADDLRDGQNWNWIDYDNDRDLDGFVTNWRPDAPNQLYQNKEGVYTALSPQQVGPITAFLPGTASLGNLWADFDNDGDIDCFVTTGNGLPDRFYFNSGNGTFVEGSNLLTLGNTTSRGASAGDYDNDGDIDLFVVSASSNTGLYQNDGNNNRWINIQLEGRQANRSAIGAIVQVKALFNGSPQWQMREITAQNAFNGQNSLRVHFGLADAEVIDSLIISWPGSGTEVFHNLQVNQHCHIIEGEGSNCALRTTNTQITKPGILFSVFPNPITNNWLTIQTKNIASNNIEMGITDVLGHSVFYQKNLKQEEIKLNLSFLTRGVYFLYLKNGVSIQTKRIVVQ